MTPSLALGPIDHFALPCFAPEASERFYRDVLGLPVLETVRGTSPVWQNRAFTLTVYGVPGGACLDLFAIEGLARGAADPAPVGSRHVALAVARRSDLDAWKARLEAAGTWTSEFVPHSPDRVSLYFFDPNGHQFELTHRGAAR